MPAWVDSLTDLGSEMVGQQPLQRSDPVQQLQRTRGYSGILK
jgi:hypothetical protein